MKRPTVPTGYTYDPLTGGTKPRRTRRNMTVGEMLFWYGYWTVFFVVPLVLGLGPKLLGLSLDGWLKLALTLLYIVVVGYALFKLLNWLGNAWMNWRY